MFFYLGLSATSQEGSSSDAQFHETLGGATYVLESYGVQRFLTDIDAGRRFWDENDSIVHSLLDWASTDGFSQLFNDPKPEYSSATAFRSRYLLRAFGVGQ
jgi:hypothetical protein